MTEPGPPEQRILGRYVLFDEIASGGMASVHLGRMLGPAGFNKTIAIKRLHPHIARDPEFVSMFLDEARVAARIQHPNVVATLDIVPMEGEVFLVLDYVQGESLSHLLKAVRIRNERVHPRIMASIMVNALHGLHAAHEATDEHGRPLGIVHRDVSPQNILVGIDGVARVLDFGVAKAAGRLQSTRDGQLKGKIAYMAPEQIRGTEVDRRTDVYAAAVVLWEGLSGQRLVHGLNEGQVLGMVLAGNFPPPSSIAPDLAAYDAAVMRGLEADPRRRYPTAREMAIVVERNIGVASSFEVAEWVQSVGAETLAIRAARVREMESTSAVRVSLDDEHAPSVVHSERSNPAFDRSRSGITATGAASAPHPPAPAQQYGGYAPAAPPPLPGSQPAWPEPQAYVIQSVPISRTKLVVLSVVASGLMGLLMIAVALLLRGKPSQGPQPAAAPPVSATAQPSRVLDVPPVAVAGEETKPPQADPPASEAPAPSAAVAEKPPPAKTARPPATGGGTPVKPPPQRCDPPFYVDSSGIKHIKPECM
jgi:eukaryotic-like serine/threonine-protein kinase